MTNLERLQEAGLIADNYQFSDDDKDAIESLSPAEVDHIISSKEKLGESFIRQHVPHGMMF
ncbi:MAG TPA: hypothetical protein VF088_09180 [Pyrinomonadaceae bacterium]